MGRAFTGDFNSPLISIEYDIHGERVTAFHSAGSPALVVHHGLHVLFPDQLPDLLISGINYGENLGTNVTVSGTIGAAFEGAAHGIPSLAVSLETPHGEYYHYSEQSWDAAAHFVTYFARGVLKSSLPFDVDVLKIDVPDTATSETPWRITKVSRCPYYTSALTNPSLDSTIADAKLMVNAHHTSVEPESDIYALTVERIVSVTPLSLDCTSRTDLSALRTVLDGQPS
jgi:5'-nucleotidase